MANISLDGFLNSKESKSLADLDWLDVNIEEYQNLPFDPTPEYISVPKLEQSWTHENDRSQFNLVPNSDFNFNYDMPKHSSEETSLEDAAKLLAYTKKQMMSGKKGEELKNLIQERTNPQVIKAAFDELKKLSNEQGLLGHVYIDPSVFSKCEEGAEFVRKRAKTAKYLQAMDKCSGCVFNRENRCEVYKKHLASEIVYDKDLFDFYSRHLSNVTGKEVKIASRSDLKKAFVFEEDKKTKVAEFKPTSKEVDEEKSLEKKEEEYKKQLNDLQESLTNVVGSRVAKDISWHLMKGYSSDIINKHIKQKYSEKEISENKTAIVSVLEKQGSLGKVYIDTSLLPINLCDKKVAKDFFDKHARDVKYVLANCNCTSCGCKTLANKTVITSLDDIPDQVWDSSFNSYSNDIKNKLSSVYNLDKKKGLRLAYIQDGLSKNNIGKTGNVENFELSKNVDASEYEGKEEKKVFFTPKNISAAISKGFTLSKIVKTGSSLGVSSEVIKENIVKAFESYVGSINKYQIDLDINVPSNVKVNVTGKDISIDLEKSSTEQIVLSYDSSSAAVDNLVNELDLKQADLSESSFSSTKYEDLQISGLDQFNIE